MHGHGLAASGALLAVAIAGALSWGPARAVDGEDTAFAALQVRGEEAMGVDQYTSTHLFDALPDGGRIELQRDVDDSAGVGRIRRHLEHIANAFSAGDFSTPAFVHLRELPGVAVMASHKAGIEYVYRELPRGAELRLVTTDPEAIGAIHEFMAFQREAHRSGGTDAAAIDHGAMHERAIHHGRAHQPPPDHGHKRGGTP